MPRVVIVGAGIAGVAVAHQLANAHGITDVTIVDPRPPLTLTSDKSTECYRNWWPNPAMVGLMNRSIDLLEEMAADTNNTFGLGRRGYLFVTARQEVLDRWIAEADAVSAAGGGSVRVHPGDQRYLPSRPEGFEGLPDGVDIFTGPNEVQRHFPYLTTDAVGALHVRRAGWFSAQQLGAALLERATDRGVTHLADQVVGIATSHGQVTGVELAANGHVNSDVVVNAAGPLAIDVGRMVGVDLPLSSEIHLKVAFKDHLGAVPRSAPMVIWSDPQHLDWTPDEREALKDEGREDLLGEMPVFCHGRPEGGAESPYFLALWEYHGAVTEPTWPIPEDDLYPEVVARGLTTMLPGFGRYLEGLPASEVDGGYYTKTPENTPLLGPAGPEGFHLACGYSGFGVMVASGAADLVSRHITGADLPDYADAFHPGRYDDPGYLARVGADARSGQL